MPSISAEVVPELLVWARKNANYERIAVARKIKVDEHRLEEWETGVAKPTIAQLRALGRVYHRPIALFFLVEPPSGFDAMRDYRRFDIGEAPIWSPELHVEYQRALIQRDAVLDIAQLERAEPSDRWKLPPGPVDTDAAVARKLRQMLRETSPYDTPTDSADEYKHLTYWSAAVEEAGVMLMTTGGGKVKTAEMRAFSMYFDEVPVVVLNGADWPRGRMFSLVHEMAHLSLRTAGLCDTSTDAAPATADRRLEARCNAIAAEVLMPASSVLASKAVRAHTPGEPWSIRDLVEAARPFGVSVESFLRRLADLGRVPLAEYEAFHDAQPEIVRRGDRKGNPTFYQVKVRDLGRGYVRTVTGAYERGALDTASTAGYLGAKVGQIERLAKAARLA